MAIGVKDYDKGWKKLKREIKGMRNVVAEIGPRGDRNVMLANVHEFGAPQKNIPARPHLRPAFDENKKRLWASMKQGAGKMVDNKSMDAEPLLIKLAGEYRAFTIKKIYSGLTPLVKKRTQRRKDALGQGSRALIATGVYRGSLKEVVFKK